MLREDRRLKLGGEGKKYDARIDYIESSGTLYIDTGFIPTGGCICEYEGTFLEAPCILVSSHSASSTNNYNRNYLRFRGENIFDVDKCDNMLPISRSDLLNTKHIYYHNTIGTSNLAKIDDVTVANGSSSSALAPDSNVEVFRLNWEDARYSGRIYWLKIYDSNSVLVRDFIPVRIGTEACLYDKVTEEVYHNAGTGSFTYGGDVTPIEYIENTGTSYINTRFKPNQDTKVVADMQGVTSTDYGRFFGCVGGTSYNSAPTFVMNYETGFSGSLHFMWGSDTSWNTNSNYSSSTATKRTVYTVDKNVLKVDGTTAFTRTYSSWLATANLAIFSYMKTNGITTDAGENFKGRVYGFQIYDNGTLVRDYIPAVAGTTGYLYDIENDILYSNSGSGKFKLSPDSGYVEPDYVFSASNTSISHAYGGASTSVTITSTADGSSQGYYVSSKPSWVTTSISGSTLTILSSSNSNTSSRSGSVVLTQEDSGNIVSISVSQAGLPTETVTVTSNVSTVIFVGSNRSSSYTTSYTTSIPYGTTYDVYGTPYISGYDAPATQTFTAGQPTRSVSLTYTQSAIHVYFYVNSSNELRVYADKDVYYIYINLMYITEHAYQGLTTVILLYNGEDTFVANLDPKNSFVTVMDNGSWDTFQVYSSADEPYRGAPIVYNWGQISM